MSSKNIDILGPDALCSESYSKTADGLMAVTLKGQVKWPDYSREICYIKCFSKRQWLGVVNEVTGYLIAQGSGLPVPNRAAVLRLPSQLLGDLQSRVGEEVYPFAFVVSEAPGTTPNTIISGVGEAQAAAAISYVFSGWVKVPDLIAFDDWTANQDRNLGNFLIESDQSVYVIDHSNMPVTLQWIPVQLDPHLSDNENMLIKIFQTNSMELPSSQIVSEAGASHSDIYQSVYDELVYWWDIFLEGDASRRAALENFLCERSKNSQARLTTALA